MDIFCGKQNCRTRMGTVRLVGQVRHQSLDLGRYRWTMEWVRKHTPKRWADHQLECDKRQVGHSLGIYSLCLSSQPIHFARVCMSQMNLALLGHYLFKTPIFPSSNSHRGAKMETRRYVLRAPLKHRLNTRPENVRESPKQNMESDKPNRPPRMTGFRPMRSERRLQFNTVNACAK